MFIILNRWSAVSISIPLGVDPCVGVVQASCFLFLFDRFCLSFRWDLGMDLSVE